METEGSDKELLNYLEALGRIAATDDGKTLLNFLNQNVGDMSCTRNGFDTNAMIWHSAQKELVQGLISDSKLDIESLKRNTQEGGLINE